MSEPRRYVHRKKPTVRIWGEGSYITAGIAAGVVVFGGTATGSTPSTAGGTASGAVQFPATVISEITLQLSAEREITFGGTATGRAYITRTTQTAPVVFAGTATAANIAANAIQFAGTATAAGGFFTSEVAATIVLAGTVSGINLATASSNVVFAGTVGQPEISGGTVTGTVQPGEIAFGGDALADLDGFVTLAAGTMAFTGTATGVRILPPGESTGDVDRITFRVSPYANIRITLA